MSNFYHRVESLNVLEIFQSERYKSCRDSFVIVVYYLIMCYDIKMTEPPVNPFLIVVY